MNDDPTEISLAYLDVLCCALAGMLLIFFVFSLFNRQGESAPAVGRIAPLSSERTVTEELSEDEDVRLFLVDIGGCTTDAQPLVDDMIVGRVSPGVVSVLVKSTEPVNISLDCPEQSQQVRVRPVRSPHSRAVRFRAQGQVTLSYDRTSWSI